MTLLRRLPRLFPPPVSEREAGSRLRANAGCLGTRRCATRRPRSSSATRATRRRAKRCSGADAERLAISRTDREPHVAHLEPHVAHCEPHVAHCEPHVARREPHVARRAPPTRSFGSGCACDTDAAPRTQPDRERTH
eukprot:126790-Pleurochrysis_carterae.AAC.5